MFRSELENVSSVLESVSEGGSVKESWSWTVVEVVKVDFIEELFQLGKRSTQCRPGLHSNCKVNSRLVENTKKRY